ncbi:MAG: LysR substrate-binding domain-containing protein [Burkholderiaceae bacterium]|nr:LysR substrate-binding domain-containing protein [Burkholderiaceae bacterium]
MLERIHLAIVREVQRRGSLTAAAEVLCLTHSALSLAVRKLEDRLGAPIWQRDGRRLRLTPAGEHLLALARRVLPQLERAEEQLRQVARGERGTLRIGMECHPCQQWLLPVVRVYLQHWPDVEVDVRQQFQFGGLGALLAYEIDVLVTPDPLHRPGLRFEPVFDYEQVLVVPRTHRLAAARYALPRDLAQETLITYPVEPARLDVFALFLTPAGIAPRRHRTIETTDILLQMVASGRGVTALPRWLVQQHPLCNELALVRLGRRGIRKRIHLGVREADLATAYLRAFIDLARAYADHAPGNAPSRRRRV